MRSAQDFDLENRSINNNAESQLRSYVDDRAQQIKYLLGEKRRLQAEVDNLKWVSRRLRPLDLIQLILSLSRATQEQIYLCEKEIIRKDKSIKNLVDQILVSVQPRLRWGSAAPTRRDRTMRAARPGCAVARCSSRPLPY